MRCCALLLTCFVFACDSPTSIPRGVNLHASLSHSVAIASDAIYQTVTARNESSRDHQVHGSNVCLAILEVRRARTARVVWGDPRICDLASVQHALPAEGGELVDLLPVTHLSGAPLEPGNYRVRAAMVVSNHGLVWSRFADLVITAP